ncbi:MAG: pilus assembly protein PilF, partial [Sulfuricella sp.]|nr:pilus assembly protein PilF [Sulfuricella sp.]
MRDFFRTFRYFSLWFALFVLALAIMTPGLKGEFFFDDNPNIVENNAVHIKTLNLEAFRASIAGPDAGPLGRPVSVLSFALTHYFFGLDPFAFKAINLAIHVINGLLVAWLVTLLLRTLRGVPLSEKVSAWLPLWVAAIWLVHPINIIPVMLAVQRMTLLSGMFMLLALIGHLKAMSAPPETKTKWAWFAASWLVFWPLSVLSKETGLLFPLYVLAITLLTPSASVSPLRKKSWVAPASVFALLVIALAMLSFLGWGWLDAAYAMRPFSLAERLMTEARVLWFYAAQIVIPDPESFGLYLDDFSLSTGLLSPPATLF